MRSARCWCLLVLMISASCLAHASAALFLEEPYGTFGALNPTGHAAVYLSDVCAETPVHLRPCQPGEIGVVISRYHRVAGYDWIAIPLIPYLYAVDSLQAVPATASPALEASLRDAYRREHLLEIVPNLRDGGMPDGDWTQLVGASYDRKIFAYTIETTAAQDLHFIEVFNARSNQAHFNLLFRNCADMSRNILDIYFPHSIHRSFTADMGMTTPKQVARSLKQFAKRNNDLEFSTFVLPQIAGTISRSRPVDGVVESFLKTKYVVPVAVFEPFVAIGLVTDYFVRGRFNPGLHAKPLPAGSGVTALYAAMEEPRQADGALSGTSGLLDSGIESGAAGAGDESMMLVNMPSTVQNR